MLHQISDRKLGTLDQDTEITQARGEAIARRVDVFALGLVSVRSLLLWRWRVCS